MLRSSREAGYREGIGIRSKASQAHVVFHMRRGFTADFRSANIPILQSRTSMHRLALIFLRSDFSSSL